LPCAPVSSSAPTSPGFLHNVTADAVPEPYMYSYLFAYAIDLPAGARTITLPDNKRIRILAMTVADEPWVVTPAQLCTTR
jgi:alpha-mannosidase